MAVYIGIGAAVYLTAGVFFISLMAIAKEADENQTEMWLAMARTK